MMIVKMPKLLLVFFALTQKCLLSSASYDVSYTKLTLDALSWAVTTCPPTSHLLSGYYPAIRRRLTCARLCHANSTCKSFSVVGDLCKMWIFDFVPGFASDATTANPVDIYTSQPMLRAVNLAYGKSWVAHNMYLTTNPKLITDGVVGCASKYEDCLCAVGVLNSGIPRYIVFDLLSLVSFSEIHVMTSYGGDQKLYSLVDIHAGPAGGTSDPVLVNSGPNNASVENFHWHKYKVPGSARYITLSSLKTLCVCELAVLP